MVGIMSLNVEGIRTPVDIVIKNESPDKYGRYPTQLEVMKKVVEALSNTYEVDFYCPAHDRDSFLITLGSKHEQSKA